MFYNFFMFFFFVEEYAVDEEVVKPVDIGFPSLRLTKAEQIAIKSQHFKQQKANATLEKLARAKQCKFCLDHDTLTESMWLSHIIIFLQWRQMLMKCMLIG